MGNKIMSLLVRPLRNYNLESRAHAVISQQKPKPAPKYKADEATLNVAMKEHADVFEENKQKNKELDDFLKEVFVKSEDPVEPIASDTKNMDRPLPVDRKAVFNFEYGLKEPDHVPEGKVTLKTALNFITDHQQDAKVNSSEKIAETTKVSEETIKNVLRNYKVYEVYIPSQRKVKAKFAGPSVPRIRIVSNAMKQLEEKEQAPKLEDTEKENVR